MPRLGRTYDRILEAVAQVETGTPADVALKHLFKKARDLGSRERSLVSETVYAVLRKRRLIEDRLERASKMEKRSFADLDKPIQHRLRVLTLWALEGMSLEELEARDAYAMKRIPRAFERIIGDKLPKVKRSELEDLAIEVSLPTFLVARLADAFGLERAAAIGKALNTRAPITLRANRAKTTRDALVKRIESEHQLTVTLGRLSPDAVMLPHSVDLPSWPLYREGWAELQDEGSQLIALAVGAKPGERILDACAGAGGKTLALAAELGAQSGLLVAHDPEKKKLVELERRATRAGASIQTKAVDLIDLPPAMLESFDAVLVDAPCSATGTLRRHPDNVWRLTETDLGRETERQRQLLTSALAALKPGGRLIYATCSVLPEENEAISRNLLAQDSVEALPLASLWGAALSEKLAATHEARIGPGPSELDPDGFYVAAFRKLG